jgi:hypothetical protein
MDTNAAVLLNRVNRLILKMPPGIVDDWVVSSGYRPPQINASTPGAAKHSLHMVCKAIDLEDAHGTVDDWCMHHLILLDQEGLWLEHPSATKGWCHLQSQPPRSGKRVFYP